MTGTMITATIPCRGGLNLSSNQQELLSKPNEAIQLTNFECSRQGGYRRISGYETIGIPIDGTGDVLGVRNYKGIIVARNDKLFHSEDGSYWLQVNKDVTNVDEATVIAAAETPRVPDGRYMFTRHLLGTTEYILFTDGVNNPSILSIKGTDRASFTYRYREITEGVQLVGAKYCTMSKNQFVIAGLPNDRSSFYYSSHATTDLLSPEDDDKEIPQENFNGSTAGYISVGDIITGIRTHRDILYVFCESSIYKVQGIDTGEPVVTALTEDIGCLDGFSVQEVGGDLVFLAPDGIRTIAKTERLDDIELGVISRKISKIIDPRTKQASRYSFYSTVLRDKNQYRLWWIDLNNVDSAQKGIIAAYTYTSQDNSFAWAFSELSGLGVTCIDNSYHLGNERIIHGNQAGELCIQEQGNDFGGTAIDYIFQSAYSDFGDVSKRKNIHRVDISTRPEGTVNMGLEVRYNYESSDVHQPLVYPLETVVLPALFGDPLTTFGDPLITFGASSTPERNIYTEGSGHVVSFRIRSLNIGHDYPFDIQSLKVDLTGGGKI